MEKCRHHGVSSTLGRPGWLCGVGWSGWFRVGLVRIGSVGSGRVVSCPFFIPFGTLHLIKAAVFPTRDLQLVIAIYFWRLLAIFFWRHYYSFDKSRAAPFFIRMNPCLCCNCLCVRSPCHTPYRTAPKCTQREMSRARVKCHFRPLHLTNGFTFSSSIEQYKGSSAGQDAIEKAPASRTNGLGYAYLIGYINFSNGTSPDHSPHLQQLALGSHSHEQ